MFPCSYSHVDAMPASLFAFRNVICCSYPRHLGLAPAVFPLCRLFLAGRTTSFLTTPLLPWSVHSPTAQTADPDHIQSPCSSHEPVCLVLAWNSFTACVLLEATQAYAHILRCIYSVATGIPTATSPALDIAALWLETVQVLRLVRPQIAISYYCRQLTAGQLS